MRAAVNAARVEAEKAIEAVGHRDPSPRSSPGATSRTDRWHTPPPSTTLAMVFSARAQRLAVVGNPRADGIAAGQEGGTRRRANGRGGIPVGEASAPRGQRVDVGRPQVCRAPPRPRRDIPGRPPGKERCWACRRSARAAPPGPPRPRPLPRSPCGKTCGHGNSITLGRCDAALQSPHMVTGIEHVAIASPNPHRLADWYVDHLDFVINYRSSNSKTVFVKAADGSMIEIIESAPGTQPAAGLQAAGLRHLALTVSDFPGSLCPPQGKRRTLPDRGPDQQGQLLGLLHRPGRKYPAPASPRNAFAVTA